MGEQLLLAPDAPAIAGQGRACHAVEDLRWPVAESHALCPAANVPEWAARLNNLQLARAPDGRGWALGMSVHSAAASAETGATGRGWGPLPKWGVYPTRADALRAAKAAVDGIITEWPLEAGGRKLALRQAWHKLLDALLAQGEPTP